jgi:hypothetical protein
VLDLLTFVILAFATYRIARFLVLDTLIDGPRDKFHDWLTKPESLSVWRLKLAELLTCPYCITVWVAAGVTVFWSLVVDEWLGWAFLLVWPAVAGASLVPWAYIDDEE